MTATRRIPTSRLLVGILLHFCVPAYLLLCLAAAFLKTPVVAGWADVPGRMLWAAGWFVPGFLLATVGAAGVGMIADRRRGRAPDAAAASREALARGRGTGPRQRAGMRGGGDADADAPAPHPAACGGCPSPASGRG